MNDKKYKKQAITQVLMSEGKVPPQAIDLEEAVIGALLIDKDAIHEIDLKPEMFYKDSHRIIFEAIQALFSRSEPIDILTVVNQLRTNGTLDLVGGPLAIVQITNRIASSANIEYHAKIVHQKWIGRELIRISNESLQRAYSDEIDVFDLLQDTANTLQGVIDGAISGRVSMDDIANDELDLVMEAIKLRRQGKFVGIPTGLVDIDKITGGWQKKTLIVVGARPGMGKSRLSVVNFIKYPAKQGIPVAMYTMEMSEVELIRVLACSECGLDPKLLKDGKVSDEDFARYKVALNGIVDLPIYIDGNHGITIQYLRATASKLKREKGIKLIVIDYLQLISGKGAPDKSNRTGEVDFISRSLKGLAKELDIPIIAIASLSRACEIRGGMKKPVTTDLRESGNIESDADIILFLYRPMYYGLQEDEHGNSTEGMIEIIFGKHRSGECPANAELIKHNEYFTQFYDINNYDREIPPNKSFDEPNF